MDSSQMQTPKEQCSKLLTRFDSSEMCGTIRQVLTSRRDQKEESEKQLDELTENIKMVERKNKQLESEAEHIKMQLGKMSELCNRLHSGRLKLAKKIIDLEQKNEELENQLVEIEENIRKKEGSVRRASQPSTEELFREIMRGFGVEFVQKAGRVIARIKNKQKRCIEEIDTTDRDVTEVSEEIWQNL